jgi:hypothetical protein
MVVYKKLTKKVKKVNKIGSRAEVFHGKALKTSGGLYKKALTKNKHGRIVSLKKVLSARYKKTNPLLKLGLQQPKGTLQFGPLKLKSKSKSKSKTNNLNIFNTIKNLFST